MTANPFPVYVPGATSGALSPAQLRARADTAHRLDQDHHADRLVERAEAAWRATPTPTPAPPENRAVRPAKAAPTQTPTPDANGRPGPRPGPGTRIPTTLPRQTRAADDGQLTPDDLRALARYMEARNAAPRHTTHEEH